MWHTHFRKLDARRPVLGPPRRQLRRRAGRSGGGSSGLRLPGLVIIQKAYRFLHDDERLFKMAPIHHHFELSGWSETKVTLRFWILGLLGGLLGIALALA